MQSSPSLQGYRLPTNVDPPDDVCLTIHIPNDPAYIEAVIGALYDTTLWISWQRDTAHTGTLAAQRMKRPWFEAVQTIGKCPPADHIPIGGLLEDFEMPLRVDCDCNVFVTCCDGTEKQILTSDQVKQLILGGPGIGANQPAPGGNCVTYSAILQAQGKYVIPFPLSAGDTVQISAVDGAVNDGTIYWYCQSGQLYYAGTCNYVPIFNPLDPVPTAPHGSILGDFGSGQFGVGTALYTVPSGINKQQMTLSVNIENASAGGGQYTFLVTVCNNQTPNWVSVFDFLTDPFLGIWSPDFGAYGAGSGYAGVVNGTVPNFVQLTATPVGANITSVNVQYDAVSVGGSAQEVLAQVDGSGFGSPATPTVGPLENYAVTASATVATDLIVVLSTGTGGGADHIQKITVQGTGTKPAGWP